MSARSSATRYARALFDVALKESDPQLVADQLREFAAILAGHEHLERVLTNPVVPAANKKAAVAELASRAGLVPVLARLLALLADRDRLALVPLVQEVFRDRLLQHQNVVRAEVTTAVPLGDDGRAALARGLGELTGRSVQMTAAVDPEILGGVIAKIGSTVYDGSLKRQLERMRERLAGGA